jgi:hypothetical protein
MISLIDEGYYDRSWCCVEALMIQTLRKAYGIHLWYECSEGGGGGGGGGGQGRKGGGGEESLHPGPLEKVIELRDKQVTLQSDLPKLLFLERQMKLLG